MSSINIEPRSTEQNANYDVEASPQELPNYSESEPLHRVTPEMNWFRRTQVIKSQANSVLAAQFVFMSGGMQIAASFMALDTHLSISWFIGAIIGTVIGSAVCNIIRKKILYLLSSFFIIVGGVLFLSLSKEYNALIAARYIDGIANGLIFAPLLVLAGEELVKNFRGMLTTSFEALPFSVGIWLYLIFFSSWSTSTNPSFTLEQMLGTVSVVYGLLTIIFVFFFNVESPIFYLVRNDENQAIDSLRRLQNPPAVNNETYQQLEEHKAYVAHNKEMTFQQSIVAGLPALLKLCLYRSLVALSYSKMTSYAFNAASIVGYSAATWTLIVMGATRWLGVLIGSYTIDSVGRKKPMLFGAVVSGGMAIGIAIILDTSYLNWIDEDKMRTVLYLYFVFQFSAGLCISSCSAYLSEAFPLAVKPFYIGIAFIIELLLQIILLSALEVPDTASYFYVTASIFFGLFFYGLVTLPETKRDSLLEAQIKFKQMFHSNFLN